MQGCAAGHNTLNTYRNDLRRAFNTVEHDFDFIRLDLLMENPGLFDPSTPETLR
jgi:hypothetical protein